MEFSALVGACLGVLSAHAAADSLPNVCIDHYGNPPRPHTTSIDGVLQSLYPVGLACAARGGEVLRWTDREDRPRLACLHVPDGASKSSKRPLVVFLGGSLFRTDYQGILNDLELESKSADLSGDPARPGFIYLSVEGRDTEHFYPAPDATGLGWDNWYRNFHRDDPGLNLDAAAIDHFIDEVSSRGIVERKRQYMMGWSNGAAMAIIYGMNTKGIAATAVYSSPDPFADPNDPCPQKPFATNRRPIMTIHNRCDIIGICSTGSIGFHQRMSDALPGVKVRSVIVTPGQKPTDACNTACDYEPGGSPLGLLTPGATFHLRWPLQWNDDYLAFMRNHPLP